MSLIIIEHAAENDKRILFHMLLGKLQDRFVEFLELLQEHIIVLIAVRIVRSCSGGDS